MVSKNLVKYIHSLEHKKSRVEEGVFVAETPKIVNDLLGVMVASRLIGTEEWFHTRGILPRQEDVIVTDEELRKLSFLQHPQQVMGLFSIPHPVLDNAVLSKQLSIALDRVQDPGNLGTIIRVADWFGITTLICSEDTADAFNPKVVQATMGSIAHVNIIYTDLAELLDGLAAGTPVYGTSLSGQNIYGQGLSSTGIIVMGNEGSGISPQIMSRVTRQLFIPAYNESCKADSLNVAIATAVICAEFRRRLKNKS
ncbi:MAG: RNA methyltransferase [Prevotella sp.]|nr:RNA methyltransferase [Prevotella sp.]